MNVFETNRNALLMYAGILGGQIREKHVNIQSLVLIDKKGTQTRIDGTDQNMFGRFVVEFLVALTAPISKRDVQVLEMTDEHQALLGMIFAERWEDRHVEGRRLLIALGDAVRIDRITWKK